VLSDEPERWLPALRLVAADTGFTFQALPLVVGEPVPEFLPYVTEHVPVMLWLPPGTWQLPRLGADRHPASPTGEVMNLQSGLLERLSSFPPSSRSS
jgi:hypothetical protein